MYFLLVLTSKLSCKASLLTLCFFPHIGKDSDTYFLWEPALIPQTGCFLSMLVCMSGCTSMNVGVSLWCVSTGVLTETAYSVSQRVEVVAASPVSGCQMQQLLICTFCAFELQIFLSLSSFISYSTFQALSHLGRENSFSAWLLSL